MRAKIPGDWKSRLHKRSPPTRTRVQPAPGRLCLCSPRLPVCGGFARLGCSRLGTLLLLISLFSIAAVLPTVAHVAAQNAIVQNIPDAEALEQQGRTLYEAEQFSEAVRLWQQAVDAFKARNDELNAAMTLSNLSLAYQQLGQWQEAEEASTKSLNLLERDRNLSDSKERAQILAQSLDVRGRLQLSRGQAEAALSTWQKAESIYARVGDEAARIRNLINQAQALQVLGHYRQALHILTQLKQTLQNLPDSALKATGLRSLGNILRLVGDLGESRQVLEQSLQVAQSLKSPQAVSDTLLNLGNTARAQADNKAALEYYQQAAAASTSPIKGIQAHLNQLSLLLETKQLTTAQSLLPKIQPIITQLPPSRKAVYARINFAQSLMRLKQNMTTDSPSELEIAQLLSGAIAQAKSLKDPRAESYALGTLGGLYEQTQQLADAGDLTQQALLIAQAIAAPDIAYQWQWQLGRLKAGDDIKAALTAYDEAFKTLQSLRGDLVAINPDIQFSFRESVEPVYRQFVDLLLRPQIFPYQGEEQEVQNQNNLQKAREVIEALQLAELDNFFREACLAPKQQLDAVVDKQAPTAAIFYPIILPDRLEVILKLPQQPLRHYATLIPQAKVENTIEQLRQELTQPFAVRETQSLSQQVYNWLIQPILTELRTSKSETLVFVLDGSLRNIPMAALYDGKQYLVENYSIALAPGLQLVDPKPLKQEQLKALTAGLTQARLGFSALPNVERELEQIESEVPSQVLLNEQFTSAAFQDRVNSRSFPVVHLATHGQFSSNVDKTFILAWDKPIKVNELNDLLRTRDESRPDTIELLVLSACQTAKGDKRAALGLAGIAVRAGARSTVASLWSINDESTSLLMSQFYQELANQSLSKAEALRRAQLVLLKNPQYQRPLYWSPFVLIGNWL
jgi:CHAT domain-containing protein/tetratricopeptide (TPR) repeat protein